MGRATSDSDFLQLTEAYWAVRRLQPITEMTNTPANPADEVVPGIWIGRQSAAHDLQFLMANKIGGIVNMAAELHYTPLPGVNGVKVGIDDGVESPKGIFKHAAAEIDQLVRRKLPTLVHCAMGISRSVTAVIAYLMLHKGMGFREALAAIRKVRPVANPHPLLVRSLMRDLGSSFKK